MQILLAGITRVPRRTLNTKWADGWLGQCRDGDWVDDGEMEEWISMWMDGSVSGLDRWIGGSVGWTGLWAQERVDG